MKILFLFMNLTEKQTNKGTKESVKEAHLRHKHYKDTLFNLSTVSVKQNVIKSKAHTIGTYHQTRVALTAFDTKRYILDDNIHTLAHGHTKTFSKTAEAMDWDDTIDIL